LLPHNEALSKVHALVGKSVTGFEASNGAKTNCFPQCKATRLMSWTTPAPGIEVP
jgi:hypothetical protein